MGCVNSKKTKNPKDTDNQNKQADAGDLQLQQGVQ